MAKLTPEHKCETRIEWLNKNHYMCSCGHVEWAHYSNGWCAHCFCKNYNGEPRPKKASKRWEK